MSLVVHTYEDLCRLPDDGLRHEIIRGEHVVTPAPRVAHQLIVSRLFSELARYVEQEALGTVFGAPCDVRFAGEDVLAPDLIFVSRQFTSRTTERFLSGGPDLAVEVLSAGTALRDRSVKRDVYESGGVREYWIADLDARAIEVHRLDSPRHFAPVVTLRLDAGDSLNSPIFPGFSLPLARLFA